MAFEIVSFQEVDFIPKGSAVNRNNESIECDAPATVRPLPDVGVIASCFKIPSTIL